MSGKRSKAIRRLVEDAYESKSSTGVTACQINNREMNAEELEVFQRSSGFRQQWTLANSVKRELRRRHRKYGHMPFRLVSVLPPLYDLIRQDLGYNRRKSYSR